MKKYISLVSMLILLLSSGVSICSAQDRQNNDISSGDVEASRWFNESANTHDPDLLFKALWYVEPSPRSYQVLELYTTGMAYTARVVPNWAVQASHSGILSTEQINDIRQMLGEIQPPRTSTEPQKGQKHLAFVYLKGDTYVRHDFVGWYMPSIVEKIIQKVESEMFAQSNRTGKNSKVNPTPIPEQQNPCAKRAGEHINLEALSQKELFSYAFRRSLLPPDRDRTFKCYLQKFPNDNDDMIRLMKRWIERYENGNDGIGFNPNAPPNNSFNRSAS